MTGQGKPFLVQALDALKAGDRPLGAQLLARELRDGDGESDTLRAVLQLASHIAEIDVAIEAARRLSLDGSIGTLSAYWSLLATYGRAAEAVDHITAAPGPIQEHPAALYRLAAAATEIGRFEEAEELFRRSIAKAPAFADAWLSLAMIKTFRAGDPDVSAIETLVDRASRPSDRASFLYALGKAREDSGDIAAAFGHYSEAGNLRRLLNPPDIAGFEQAAEAAISGFDKDLKARLLPSRFKGRRSLFVTGLPRSGTTLTEQILRGHSSVSDGGEINLFGASVISTLGIQAENALAYQARRSTDDPWGDIGREYARLLDMRFRAPGSVVDKSLGQSLLIGLLLHALPDARIAWLRRSPEDVALSCFRTQFVGGLSWTSSLEDIADHMMIEDRLFAHWRGLFGDRILEVPYEQLVHQPDAWAERLQGHFGLPVEPRIHEAQNSERSIKTASVVQARGAITADRVGRAQAFDRHLGPFRARYRGSSNARGSGRPGQRADY